jgi:hypothetical protein
MDNLTNELAAALRNLLDQTRQMCSMFPDDEALENAMKDADETLKSYWGAVKRA